MTRPPEQHEEVHRLLDRGLNSKQIAGLTGAPDSTVRLWRHGPRHPKGGSGTLTWRVGNDSSYSYLLGLYLGDGHVASAHKNPFLRFFLDRLYPGVISDATRALERVFPDSAVRRYDPEHARLTILQISHQRLPYLLPHGPGRKHERPIVLAPWQRERTHRHPEHFLRGLIHSDGCRCMNRFKTRLPSGRVAEYEYPRYFFSNLSADIRRLFCDHCDLLGIRWSLSNPRNVSVSHRDSVALLDSFIGPKS